MDENPYRSPQTKSEPPTPILVPGRNGPSLGRILAILFAVLVGALLALIR